MPKSPLEIHDREQRRRHSKRDVWQCPQCHYNLNVDEVSPNCQNCGADFRGRPGTAPSKLDKEPRPGLRDDIGG